MPVLEELSSELAWMLPGSMPNPADAVARIGALCASHRDAYTAMFSVLATHPGVPRERLAAAIKQFRREYDELSLSDVEGLLTSIWNGGRSGYDSTLRSRKKAERKAAASLPWMAAD
jgi:hypothetical protein